MKDIFSKLRLNVLKNYLNFIITYHFYWKVEKLIANLHDKSEYVIHIKNLKQALRHALFLKKIHKVIKSNEHAWPKSYVDMNTDLRAKVKHNFEKRLFSKFINNAVFGKPMENVTKHRDIKLVKLFSIRTKLLSYKFFH